MGFRGYVGIVQFCIGIMQGYVIWLLPSSQETTAKANGQ